MSDAVRKSPRAALARISTKVQTWPAYLRCHSSAYYERKAGTRETVEVTRRQDAYSKFVVVPPGEWPQDEADWAIKRGQELAEKYGW